MNVQEEVITPQEMANLAEMRSKVYAFLGSIYTQIPDQAFVARLTDGSMTPLLDALTTEEMPGEIVDGLGLVKGYLAACREIPPEQVQTDLAVERTRLLRGIKPGYGPPPPYESVYVGSGQQPLMQAGVAVAKVYAEAGVGLSEEVHDQPDFIGFELDFMRHLTEKEAQAWADGNAEEALRVLEKEQAFLNKHITRWIPRFCDVMVREAQLDFYRGIARMTKGFVLDEAQRAAELVEWVRAA